MDANRPSPLEADLLEEFYHLYKAEGFPPPSTVHLRHRENTGAGRYVDLEAPSRTKLDRGVLDLGGQYIEMDGIPDGLMAVARIDDHRLRQIEIAVYGGDPWDGAEREWRISGPVRYVKGREFTYPSVAQRFGDHDRCEI